MENLVFYTDEEILEKRKKYSGKNLIISKSLNLFKASVLGFLISLSLISLGKSVYLSFPDMLSLFNVMNIEFLIILLASSLILRYTILEEKSERLEEYNLSLISGGTRNHSEDIKLLTDISFIEGHPILTSHINRLLKKRFITKEETNSVVLYFSHPI